MLSSFAYIDFVCNSCNAFCSIDHWKFKIKFNYYLSVTFGNRFTGQTKGQDSARRDKTFQWIDIWNETFDRLHGIERDDPRIRDVTLQRLLDNQIVIKDPDDVVFRHT